MRTLLALVLMAAPLAAADLAAEFANPPAEARPRVYWLWLHGNVSKSRITYELEEMKKKGIGGVLHWDPGPGPSRYGTRATPLPPSPLFMSPPWRDALHHALAEAGRLGLDFSLSLSPGPNCGGPWITPERSAQKLVWSSVSVTGPVHYSGVLPIPDGVERQHYRDIAVFAAEPFRVGHSRSTQEISQVYPVGDLSTIEFGSPWIDITKNVDANGKLEWDVPPGMYRILRLGHAPTGQRADYFRPEGAGMLADHMDAAVVEFNFKTMLKELFGDGPLPQALKYVHCDSYEVYGSDWTPALLTEFRKRRGYDPTPYLPTLEGGNVNSRALTARFRADLDRTRSDLFADNHYQKLLDLAHARGVGFHSESGGPRVIAIDTLKMLGRNDVPMGEFWAKAETHRVTEEERFLVKEIASAAHIYGKRWAGFEAFTSVGPHWEEDPWSLKADADKALLEGANRFFLHTFTHSPEQFGKPGIEYFAGTHFNPNITWWEQARAWTDYLSRCSVMLSQGRFVADVVYYYGEHAPNYVPPKHVDPSLGAGYDYDVVNAEVLLTRMKVRDGRLVLPDGMSYAVMVLPQRKDMSPEVLRKVAQLVNDGATVMGPPPSEAPGLSGYPERDREVQRLARALWNDGAKRVINGPTIREVLQRQGIAPDFEAPASVEAIHRRTEDADIYYVVNKTDAAQSVECRFRVKGKAVELWAPETGERRAGLLYREERGTTVVPLQLGARGSVFVVFRGAAANHAVALQGPKGELVAAGNGMRLRAWQPGEYTVRDARGRVAKATVDAAPSMDLTGRWTVRFAPGWGAPASAVFERLVSWSERPEEGIRYFSGAATYELEFDAPQSAAALHAELDLGEVANLADVRLNGQSLGVLWMPPFRANASGVLRAGKNRLEVTVVNLWPNRMIGDEKLAEAQRFTKTNMRKFTEKSPLRASGLLGPVRIVTAREADLKF